MSDRDPRYNPMELLINATAADTENSAEWSALYDFHKLAEEWKQARKQMDRTAQAKRLLDKLLEMSQSEVLEPVVWRAYEKVCAEDAAIVRKEQEAEFQRKLQEISDQYNEHQKIVAENRCKQQEPAAQAETINQQTPTPETPPKKFFHKLSDIWYGILPILLLVGIPTALCVIIGWSQIPKVISALGKLGGGSWFLGAILALFAGIGALNICVGICHTIEKIGDKMEKKASLWLKIYLVATLLGIAALIILLERS